MLKKVVIKNNILKSSHSPHIIVHENHLTSINIFKKNNISQFAPVQKKVVKYNIKSVF